MFSAKDYLRLLIDCLTDEEAEELLLEEPALLSDCDLDRHMFSAKDYLRLWIDCLTDEEAEQLLEVPEEPALLSDGDLVDSSSSCPNCGERRFNLLEWTSPDCLVCETCGTTYDPNRPGAVKE